MATLVELLAARHLGGPLADDATELMRPLDGAREEVHACLRRAFRWMEQARFRPEDFSLALAAFFAVQMPNVLPGMWGGMVPPITTAGRHERLDAFVASNPYWQPKAGARFLDVGCGFPPLTALDTAQRFPEFEVTAIDPAFGSYLVYDERGDYACLDAAGEVRFVTGAAITPERRAALYRDMDATRARFAGLRDALLPLLPSGAGPAEAGDERGRIVRQPIAQYERPNLRFFEMGIGAEGLAAADVVRVMNVLLYFPREFGAETRVWAARLLRPGGLFLSGYNAPLGENAMYFVWRRDADALTPVEFAFDATLMRALSPAFFGYRDDEEERSLLCPVLAALTGDGGFRAELDRGFDAALMETGLALRRADGYLGGLPANANPAWVRSAWRDLVAERGGARGGGPGRMGVGGGAGRGVNPRTSGRGPPRPPSPRAGEGADRSGGYGPSACRPSVAGDWYWGGEPPPPPSPRAGEGADGSGGGPASALRVGLTGAGNPLRHPPPERGRGRIGAAAECCEWLVMGIWSAGGAGRRVGASWSCSLLA